MKRPFISCLIFCLVAVAGPALAQRKRPALPLAAARPAPEVLAAPEGCNSYSGTITAGGQPLASVSIFVKGTSIIVITNEMGFFNLPGKIQSAPTLELSAAGYEPLTYTVESCTPAAIEMKILPGTRIRKHGKRKGQLKRVDTTYESTYKS